MVTRAQRSFFNKQKQITTARIAVHTSIREIFICKRRGISFIDQADEKMNKKGNYFAREIISSSQILHFHADILQLRCSFMPHTSL